jgi:protein-disulfide isomerase
MPLDPPLGPEDHVRGEGPLELVMYGDFQCPYCAAAQPIVDRVRRRLDGRLRFAFRHLPIPELHPDAQAAAEASEAAAAQGAFWSMHDRLYAARDPLEVPDLIAYASELGLDAERVRTELAGHAHAARVERDRASAVALGVRGTPTFFVNGARHDDAFDAGSLVQALTRSGS